MRRRAVLVVDDDASIRSVLVTALNDDGYDTRSARDGREALALLENWRPDLIVLDLMMPGMDGWTFRAEQRRRPELASIPVLIFSASRDVGVHGPKLDAAGVVPKPFDLEALMAEIDGVAHRGAAERGESGSGAE